MAYIAGGETVVHLTGKGLGGRNQEIALSAAAGLDGLKDVLLFSLGWMDMKRQNRERHEA